MEDCILCFGCQNRRCIQLSYVKSGVSRKARLEEG